MEQRKKVLKNFNNDELATDVFMKKYATKNEETGELLEFSLDDMRDRLATAIIKAETFENQNLWLGKFRKTLDYFTPGGRILYALGNPNDMTATLKNCYVIQIDEDSIDGIFETAKRQAKLFSKGGGVGFDISTLRPKGAPVNNSAKTTTGAVSFMDLYSMVTGLIGQYGRRGALMLTMDIKSPDIIDFIKVKGGGDKSKVQFANISVKISDEFIQALKNDEEWEMSFKLKNGTYITKKEKASIIWDLFVESNWAGAEPGILFWNNVLKEPASVFDETRPVSTNPCGELPLNNGGSCCLGSIDLNKFVKNSFTDTAEFDYTLFGEIIENSIRFLDNVNILNLDREPLDINKEATLMGNKIGLGITGLADCFIRLNIVYGSETSKIVLNKIGKILYLHSIKASVNLSKERGKCQILKKYENTEEIELWTNHTYFKNLTMDILSELKKYGTRNIGYTTCAPSGSISIVLQTSSGIEPIFMLSYDRTIHQAGKTGQKEKYTIYHPLVLEYNKIFGENAHFENPNFITSKDINWKDRVDIQAILQQYISSAISSTINLPKETTKETISDIYKYAHEKELKGITIYRDGCREGVLNATEKDKREWQILDDYKFPDNSDAKLKVIRSEGKKWYITYTIDPETKLPNALFVNTNNTETTILTEDVLDHLIKLAKKYIKNGHLEKLLENAANKQPNVVKIARVLGMLLRHRVPIIEIIKTIEIINPPIYSFIFQIKKLLGEYLPENTLTGEKCESCGSLLIFQSGCSLCPQCGNSKCS